MSGAEYRRWIDYYAYRFEQQERISYQLGHVCSLLAGGFFRAETDPEDWIPGASAPEPEAVRLPDRDLAMQLALSLGAEIRYA